MEATPQIDAALAAMTAAASAHANLLVSLGYRGQSLDVAALPEADRARLDAAWSALVAAERAYEGACVAAGWAL